MEMLEFKSVVRLIIKIKIQTYFYKFIIFLQNLLTLQQAYVIIYLLILQQGEINARKISNFYSVDFKD
jgi:hypothetical protein